MEDIIYTNLISNLKAHRKLLVMELSKALLMLSYHNYKHFIQVSKHFTEKRVGCYLCKKIYACQNIIKLTKNELQEVDCKIEHFRDLRSRDKRI